VAGEQREGLAGDTVDDFAALAAAFEELGHGEYPVGSTRHDAPL
jgi:hypothetical protein